MVAHGQSDHHHSHLWDRFTPQKVASTNNIWPKITNLPSSRLPVWLWQPNACDLLHPPCIICVSRRCVFCKTQWGPQQQGQERPPSPQYSNQVQSACLTLLTLSGPWPAWLWWLSARSQLRSQTIKWGQPLLFRGTHYSETICLKETLNFSVSKNWFSFYKEYTIYVLYFPEYILKSHLNLSFNAYVITSYVITIHPTFSNSFFATPSFSFLLAWVHVRDNSITQWSQLKHYLGPHNHRAARMTYCL